MVRILYFLSILSLGFSDNTWPIIGIFTQPSSESNKECGGDCLYLAASYVKYVESAGARVVPVNYYSTDAEIDALMMNLNGIVFPGGGAPFPASAQRAFDQTVALNKEGDFFPLLGTCMGFQWLLISATRDTNILDPKQGQMDSYNYSIPLDLASAATQSRMLGDAPASVLQTLTQENSTMNNHHYGIWTDHYLATPALTSLFSLLSTNNDRAGRNFVSTIEAYDYPIYGTQWHPEKNPFEWQLTPGGVPLEAIDHSGAAVAMAQYMASFFVSEARRSDHRYADEAAEEQALIYNYSPVRTAGSFVQTYFFPNDF